MYKSIEVDDDSLLKGGELEAAITGRLQLLVREERPHGVRRKRRSTRLVVVRSRQLRELRQVRGRQIRTFQRGLDQRRFLRVRDASKAETN